MLAGVGLTVALFVANEAFSDNGLQSQAKFGAVLSVVCGGFAFANHRIFGRREPEPAPNTKTVESEPATENAVSDMTSACDSSGQSVQDILVDDVIEMLRTQRRYRKRGVDVPLSTLHSRSTSKTPISAIDEIVKSVRSASKDPVRSAACSTRRSSSNPQSPTAAWVSSSRQTSKDTCRSGAIDFIC